MGMDPWSARRPATSTDGSAAAPCLLPVLRRRQLGRGCPSPRPPAHPALLPDRAPSALSPALFPLPQERACYAGPPQTISQAWLRRQPKPWQTPLADRLAFQAEWMLRDEVGGGWRRRRRRAPPPLWACLPGGVGAQGRGEGGEEGDGCMAPVAATRPCDSALAAKRKRACPPLLPCCLTLLDEAVPDPCCAWPAPGPVPQDSLNQRLLQLGREKGDIALGHQVSPPPAWLVSRELVSREQRQEGCLPQGLLASPCLLVLVRLVPGWALDPTHLRRWVRLCHVDVRSLTSST